jgi:putative transposase
MGLPVCELHRLVTVIAGKIDMYLGQSNCSVGLEPPTREHHPAMARRVRARPTLRHWPRGSQYTSEQFQRLMADNGVVCSMSRSGNVWDNAAMERFISSLKTERTGPKTYRTRDEARADVVDYIERFYNPKRRHSTIGYLIPTP